MKYKILHFYEQERGNIIVLFALTLVVLIFFIGLSIDISMICLQRNTMQDLCQIIREDRFTYQDTIRYADNPGLTSYQIIYDSLEDNNFNGTVKVYFCEDEPASNYRSYHIRTELSEEYSYSFARIFGFTSRTVTVSLDGGETYGESGNDVVWHSPIAVADYNGSYTSKPSGGYIYDSHDIPPGW